MPDMHTQAKAYSNKSTRSLSSTGYLLRFLTAMIAGLLSICALDAFFTRAARQRHRPMLPPQHPHAQ